MNIGIHRGTNFNSLLSRWDSEAPKDFSCQYLSPRKGQVIFGLPIGSAEFEKGKPFPALGDRILEFLAMNDGKAYMEAEIGVEMMQADGGDPVLQALTIVGRQAVVLAVLDNLVRDGKIVARIQHKMPYYMLATQLGSKSSNTKSPTL